MEKNKPRLIKNIDPVLWGLFAGLCKIDKVLVGQKLNEIIYDYLINSKKFTAKEIKIRQGK